LLTRIINWAGLFSEYASTEIISKGLAAIAALLIVNYFSIMEFAIYTLALSIFIFISTFTDLGLTKSLLYFRRLSIQTNQEFKHYLGAVLVLRNILLVIGFIIGIFIFYYSGKEINLSFSNICLIFLLVIVASYFNILSSLNLFVLRIESEFRKVYFIEIIVNLIKFVAVCLIVYYSFLHAWIAILIITLTVYISALLAKFYLQNNFVGYSYVDNYQSKNKIREIYKYITPTIPSALYFSIQLPLVIWLASYFGDVSNIAEVGALGRLSAIVALISGFILNVILPRMANAPGKGDIFKYVMVWVMIILFGSILLLFTSSYPQLLLILIGDNYSNLNKELFYMILAAIISSGLTYADGINRTMGWLKFYPSTVGLLIVAQIIFINILDLSKTIDLVLFSLFSILVQLILQITISLVGFLNPSVVKLTEQDN